MTDEQLAINQYLGHPCPIPTACGCVGPQLLPGETTIGEDGFTDFALYTTAKREPFCPCAMKWVEQVNGNFWLITEPSKTSGKPEISAELIGPVGGPYSR